MTRDEFDRQFTGYMADLNRNVRMMTAREIVQGLPYQVALIIGGLNRLADAVRIGEVDDQPGA